MNSIRFTILEYSHFKVVKELYSHPVYVYIYRQFPFSWRNKLPVEMSKMVTLAQHQINWVTLVQHITTHIYTCVHQLPIFRTTLNMRQLNKLNYTCTIIHCTLNMQQLKKQNLYLCNSTTQYDMPIWGASRPSYYGNLGLFFSFSITFHDASRVEIKNANAPLKKVTNIFVCCFFLY